jgi:hypothetical protein
MNIKFNDFLFEKLGINDDISRLTDFIMNKINIKNNFKNDIIIKNIDIDFPVKIERITIKFIKMDNKDWKGYFSANKKQIHNTYFNLIIYINKNLKDLNPADLNHELIHAYQFIKNSFSFLYDKTYDLYNTLLNKSSLYDNLSWFKFIIYLCNKKEIAAFYNDSYYNIKEKLKNNKNLNIDDLIEESEFYVNYNYLKDYDIKYEFKKMIEYDKKIIINFIKAYQEKIYHYYTQVDDEFINRFINTYENKINDTIKIYLKYIGRMKTLLKEI